MKNSVPFVVVGFVLGAFLLTAEAVKPVDPTMAAPGLVAIGPTFSQRPQVCGEDGGLYCVFTFDAGECVDLSTSVDIGYSVQPQVLNDGGWIYTAAGALVAGGIYADGGATSAPKFADLFASQIKSGCLMNTQAQIEVLLSTAGSVKAGTRSR